MFNVCLGNKTDHAFISRVYVGNNLLGYWSLNSLTIYGHECCQVVQVIDLAISVFIELYFSIYRRIKKYIKFDWRFVEKDIRDDDGAGIGLDDLMDFCLIKSRVRRQTQ